MHFLGAVITERKEDLEDVLAPWSEYNDVPEHVSKTRGSSSRNAAASTAPR